jgi:LTXXQ motif family protein
LIHIKARQAVRARSLRVLATSVALCALIAASDASAKGFGGGGGFHMGGGGWHSGGGSLGGIHGLSMHSFSAHGPSIHALSTHNFSSHAFAHHNVFHQYAGNSRHWANRHFVSHENLGRLDHNHNLHIAHNDLANLRNDARVTKNQFAASHFQNLHEFKRKRSIAMRSAMTATGTAGAIDSTAKTSPADREVLAETNAAANESCSSVAPDVAGLPIDQIRRAVRPTADQENALNELSSTSAKASEIIKASCPSDIPLTPVARLDAAAKRFGAMIEAAQLMRSPLDSFYEGLTDEQKKRSTQWRAQAKPPPSARI